MLSKVRAVDGVTVFFSDAAAIEISVSQMLTSVKLNVVTVGYWYVVLEKYVGSSAFRESASVAIAKVFK